MANQFDLSETGQRQWLLDDGACLTGAKAGKHDAKGNVLVHNVVGVGKAYPKVAIALAKMAVAKSMHNLNHLMAAMHTIYMNKAAQSHYMAANSGGATSEYLHQSLKTYSDYEQLVDELIHCHSKDATTQATLQQSKTTLESYNRRAQYFLSQLRAKKEAIEKPNRARMMEVIGDYGI